MCHAAPSCVDVCALLTAAAPVQFHSSYAKEVLADTREELEYDTILEQIRAVGGANYGTGKPKA